MSKIDKNKTRLNAFNFLGKFGENIKTKLKNVCGKTGQYNVPKELFQKRTSRSNRVLISWRVVERNKLTIDQLETFSGGVAVEFVNNDFFDKSNKKNKVFNELTKRLGSDEIVSSIISIRSADGNSSSQEQRNAFNKLIDNTKVLYKNKTITITEKNYKKYAIVQNQEGGTGNEKWSGFLYVSIRGGQQDTIETHKGLELTIFNPACEFANKNVCIDLDLTIAYFAMLSINKDDRTPEYKEIFKDLKDALKTCKYKFKNYTGNLLNYVENHPSVRMKKGALTDVIQVKQINIKDFSDDTRNDDSIDFTHNEAVVHEKYYWDSENKCLLTPSRPTNIFWSFHLSNMMQQNYDLESFFTYEEKRYKERKKLLKK